MTAASETGIETGVDPLSQDGKSISAALACQIHYNTVPRFPSSMSPIMRRASKRSSQKLSADSQRLVTFAQGLVLSGSRMEGRAWEHELDTSLQKQLKNNHQEIIDYALDHLYKSDLGAYDALMESLEAVSESCVIEHDGTTFDALLIAIPILAWTRFSIASGAISSDMVLTLSAHLYGHVLAENTKTMMAPMLFAIDQLPRTHAETFAFTRNLANAAISGTQPRWPANFPETAPFLSDTRYLLAAVAVPAGAPVFRWQATLNPAERDIVLEQWKAQATPNIARLLPGCGIELLLPEAYYVACREADNRIRPVSIQAAVHYLTHALGVLPSELRAIIGDFGEESADDRVDEYRIGFLLKQIPEVVYGVVWPLYGQEELEISLRDLSAGSENPEEESKYKTPLEEIIGLLKEAGVTGVMHRKEHFPMEFCEDCGAPLYSDPDGELVHAEMPEDVPQETGHFH